MSKVLLLDLDGVVLHQPRVFKQISHKIVSYVQRYAPRMYTMDDAMELNKLLYSSYAHTHRGLRAVYGNQIPPLDHFNTCIYDIHIINYLWNHRYDPELQTRANQARALVTHAKDIGVPTYVFTNSPGIWCQNAMDITNLADLIPPSAQLSSSHPVFSETLLKPDQKLYENVAMFLQHEVPGWSQLVFVDDSWANLRPVIGSPTWVPLFFRESGPEIRSQNVCTLRSFTDVQMHLS